MTTLSTDQRLVHRFLTTEQPSFADLERFVAAVAPEVADVYLLPQLEDVPEPVACVAYALECGSTVVRHALERRGLWRGAAPMIVFVTIPDERWELLGVTLHEVAHLLPRQSIDDAPPTAAELARERKLFASWAATPEPDARELPRWVQGHGRQFLRIAAHLWWRMRERFGLDVTRRHIVHDGYDVSPLTEYTAALDAELRRTPLDASFGDILAAPEPKAFSQLWESDKTAWLESREQRNAP